MALIELFNQSLLFAIVVIAVVLLLQWLFIYTAVKCATKNAFLEAYTKIEYYKTNPPKTPKEDFEEELKGWL